MRNRANNGGYEGMELGARYRRYELEHARDGHADAEASRQRMIQRYKKQDTQQTGDEENG